MKAGWIAGIALVLVSSGTPGAQEAASRWEPLPDVAVSVTWQADGLASRPQMAEVFDAPMGYRIERYFWKADKPGSSFAIAVLRDVGEGGFLLRGPVDLAKFATTVLRTLDSAAPEVIEPADWRAETRSGPVWARLLRFGQRRCVVFGAFAGGSQNEPRDADPPAEGSRRLEGLYCAGTGAEFERAQARDRLSGVFLRR